MPVLAGVFDRASGTSCFFCCFGGGFSFARGASRGAFRVGLHRTYMGDIERGEKNVTLVTADKLAKALGTTLAGLFTMLEQGSDDADNG